MLAWLVLGLSVAAAAPAESGRTPAALVCAVARTSTAVLASVSAPLRREVRRAVVAPRRASASALAASLRREARRAPVRWVARDGRHLYLENLALLC